MTINDTNFIDKSKKIQYNDDDGSNNESQERNNVSVKDFSGLLERIFCQHRKSDLPYVG